MVTDYSPTLLLVERERYRHEAPVGARIRIPHSTLHFSFPFICWALNRDIHSYHTWEGAEEWAQLSECSRAARERPPNSPRTDTAQHRHKQAGSVWVRPPVREPPAVNYLTAKIGFDVRRRPLTAYAHTSCEQWSISDGSASKQTAQESMLHTRSSSSTFAASLIFSQRRLLSEKRCRLQEVALRSSLQDWSWCKCRLQGKRVSPASVNNCCRCGESSSKRFTLNGSNHRHASVVRWAVGASNWKPCVDSQGKYDGIYQPHRNHVRSLKWVWFQCWPVVLHQGQNSAFSSCQIPLIVPTYMQRRKFDY